MSSMSSERKLILVASIALVAVAATRAVADPVEQVVRDRIAAAIPSNLGIAQVYVPASLATADVDGSTVAIDVPHELRAGRQSVKVTVKGKTLWVPVAIAAISDVAIAQRALAPGDVIAAGDIAIERRAVADSAAASVITIVGSTVTRPLAAGTAIAPRDVALPAPIARGTQLAIEVHRGAVVVRGTGILEASARPGEPATARLVATKTLVRGVLTGPSLLVAGDAP